jgi:hypothetical protein
MGRQDKILLRQGLERRLPRKMSIGKIISGSSDYLNQEGEQSSREINNCVFAFVWKTLVMFLVSNLATPSIPCLNCGKSQADSEHWCNYADKETHDYIRISISLRHYDYMGR